MIDPGPNPIQEALDNPFDAPELAQPGDSGPELDRHGDDYEGLPPGCPVTPLGNQQSIDGKQTCYYLNWNGQLVGLEAGNRHGKNSLVALFGPQVTWLEANYTAWSKPTQFKHPESGEIIMRPSQPIGFDQAKASMALIIECVRKGIFDPAGRMRGRGAHRLGTGASSGGQGVAVHCGDQVLVTLLRADGTVKGWRWCQPGLIERHVYPAAERIPRPWHEPIGPKPAEQLLQLLQTWNFRRQLLDARFVLGGIGASMLGGALRWRSNIWITGGRGTGKSTLNGKDGVIHQVFGDGLFRTGNTSAAGLRQSLKNATVPVMLDEIEASANNARVNEVIELARVASSGDTMTRGSADHTAQEFTLQSCFWFSSILIPPLQPQDRSRLAICELEPFAAGAVPPDLGKYNLADMGRQLQRRMVEGWWRLEATKVKFHAALAAVGHDNRACDQFGMLLAAADVLLHDRTASKTDDGLPPDIEVNQWVQLCRPQRMAEITETTADHQACVNHITTSAVQARGGDEREMIGTWIGRLIHKVGADPLLKDQDKADKAAERLQQIGLQVVNARWLPEVVDDAGKVTRPGRWGYAQYHPGEPGFLAVAREHQALTALFDKQTWQGGGWYQSLKRTPGHIEGVKVKFARKSLTAVLVPLAAVLDEDELPAASQPDVAAAWIDAQQKGAGA